MAEKDPSQEKTEEPTNKKLEDSKKEGQTARSRELPAMAVLMCGALGLIVMAPMLFERAKFVFEYNMTVSREDLYYTDAMFIHLKRSIQEGMYSLLPFFGVLAIAAIFPTMLVGGMLFSWKAIAPKLSKLNPLKGLKKMFSLNSLMELFKTLAKFFVVGILAVVLLLHFAPTLLALAHEPLFAAMSHGLEILAWSFLALASSLIIITMVDVPFQMYQHRKQLMMTKQEVKDEMKDTDGKPEVKGRIRQMQRQLANSRMMEAVPEADVVITNPTHYAVALQYDPASDRAPKVLARGVGLIALNIRRIAKEADVTLVEAPPLARSLYHTTEVNDEIPSGLYTAVAQVLAYVFQLKQYRPGSGPRPQPSNWYPIPDDLRYDE